MFRSTLFACALAAGTASAQDFDLSPLIEAQGLAGAEASLATQAPSPARNFALGGVRFLGAIEKTLQMRYRHNADFGRLGLPVLRLPLPPNPDAAPFDPALVTDLFRGVTEDMAQARTAWTGAEGGFGVTVDLAKIWFDINENGAEDPGEQLLATAGAALGQGAPEGADDALVIRFDSADAAWLRAYTYLLEAVGHLVLAFDPTEVIDEVLTANAAMRELQGRVPADRGSYLRGSEIYVDMVAMIYGALNRPPDVAHVHAARDALLAMIAENRAFWGAVASETDNDREWIPNATQVSAFGIELPPDTAQRWLAVLSDAEAVLNGTRLIGHWRVEPGAGINAARLLETPIPVHIVEWVHGHGLTPYMERGILADTDNLRQFERMFSGDALLFMLWLN